MEERTNLYCEVMASNKAGRKREMPEWGRVYSLTASDRQTTEKGKTPSARWHQDMVTRREKED